MRAISLLAIIAALLSTALPAGAVEPAAIAERVADASGPTPAPTEDPAITTLAKSLLTQFQSGKIDHSVFDATANAAFTDAIVGSVVAQLGPLGKPSAVTFISMRNVGVERLYIYRDSWPSTTLDESIAIDPDGKVGGIYFRPYSGADPAPSSPAASPSATPTS